MIDKWRVVQAKHHGYYNVYTVQKRMLFLFWEPIRTFNQLEDAVEYIKRQKVKPVYSIVHKE